MACTLPWLSLRRRNLTIAVIVIIFTGSTVYYYTDTGIQFQKHNFTRPMTRHKKPNSTSSLLNLSNFTFLRNPKDICSRFQNGQGKSIISVVHSARGNFKSRAIIRSTHGSVPTYRGWLIQVVFTLGISSTRDPDPEDETIEDLLEIEANQYGDIIIGNFEDSYRNLSYKHVMAYAWISEFCQGANYLIKSDDDILVNVFHAIEFLSTPGSIMSSSSNTSVGNMDKDFYCYFYTETEPVREPGKWFVSRTEYAKKIYPDYCGYGIYVTGIKTIKNILSVSKRASFLWIDDIFVSGILRELVNEKEDANNSINIIHAHSHYYPFEENMTDTIAGGNCLGVITEQRSPNISCPIWNLILEAHGVNNLYVSRCNSVL